MTVVDVVSAVIVRNGRILLTQRRPEKDFAFAWECPGGKVEGPEMHCAALLRELDEEIGIDGDGRFDVLDLVWDGEFQGDVSREDRRHIALFMYVVQVVGGRPVPREGQGIGWFTEAEMRALTLAPGNLRAIEAIAGVIRASAR